MTTNTKHTPGPWQGRDEAGKWLPAHPWLVENYSEQRTEYVPVHKEGRVIALVVAPEWDSPELFANADLIAAAPEMAEALQAMLTLHEGTGGEPYGTSDIARAALAKAGVL